MIICTTTLSISEPYELVEFFLLVGLNDAVRLRVRNAGQKIPLTHLVLVEEGALGLVDFSGRHLARTGGARPGAARERQLNPSVLSRLENVGVLGGLELVLLPVRAYELHLVHGSRRHPELVRDP